MACMGHLFPIALMPGGISFFSWSQGRPVSTPLPTCWVPPLSEIFPPYPGDWPPSAPALESSCALSVHLSPRLLLGALSIRVRLLHSSKIWLPWWLELGILFSFFSSQQKVLLVNLYGMTTLGHVRFGVYGPLEAVLFSLAVAPCSVFLQDKVPEAGPLLTKAPNRTHGAETQSPGSSSGSDANLLCARGHVPSLPSSSPSLSENEGNGPPRRFFFQC